MSTFSVVECFVEEDVIRFLRSDGSWTEAPLEVTRRSHVLCDALEASEGRYSFQLRVPATALEHWRYVALGQAHLQSLQTADAIDYLTAADFLADEEASDSMCAVLVTRLFEHQEDNTAERRGEVLDHLPEHLVVRTLQASPHSLNHHLVCLPPRLHAAAVHAAFPSILSDCTLALDCTGLTWAACHSALATFAALPKARELQLKNAPILSTHQAASLTRAIISAVAAVTPCTLCIHCKLADRSGMRHLLHSLRQCPTLHSLDLTISDCDADESLPSEQDIAAALPEMPHLRDLTLMAPYSWGPVWGIESDNGSAEVVRSQHEGATADDLMSSSAAGHPSQPALARAPTRSPSSRSLPATPTTPSAVSSLIVPAVKRMTALTSLVLSTPLATPCVVFNMLLSLPSLARLDVTLEYEMDDDVEPSEPGVQPSRREVKRLRCDSDSRARPLPGMPHLSSLTLQYAEADSSEVESGVMHTCESVASMILVPLLDTASDLRRLDLGQCPLSNACKDALSAPLAQAVSLEALSLRLGYSEAADAVLLAGLRHLHRCTSLTIVPPAYPLEGDGDDHHVRTVLLSKLQHMHGLEHLQLPGCDLSILQRSAPGAQVTCSHQFSSMSRLTHLKLGVEDRSFVCSTSDDCELHPLAPWPCLASLHTLDLCMSTGLRLSTEAPAGLGFMACLHSMPSLKCLVLRMDLFAWNEEEGEYLPVDENELELEILACLTALAELTSLRVDCAFAWCDLDVSPLFSALGSLSNLQSLHLKSQPEAWPGDQPPAGFSADAGAAFATAAGALSALKSLHINAQFEPGALEAALVGIRQLTRLTKLHLACDDNGYRLWRTGAAESSLAESLTCLVLLQDVMLQLCGCPSSTVGAVARALMHLTRLSVLDFDIDTDLRRQHAAAVLELLRHNTSVRELSEFGTVYTVAGLQGAGGALLESDPMRMWRLKDELQRQAEFARASRGAWLRRCCCTWPLACFGFRR